MLVNLKILSRYPSYRSLFFAGLLSELGTYVSETALMLHLYHLSGEDKAYIGLTHTIFLVLMTLGTLLGGPLGERYSQKKILLLCEVLRIPLVIAMLLSPSIPIIMWGNGLVAFFSGVFNPVRQSLVNYLVPEEDIGQANTMFGLSYAVLHFVGPILGAFLYEKLKTPSPILAFDFITYIVGIALLMTMKVKIVKSQFRATENLWEDFKVGMRLIRKRIDLISLYVSCSLGSFCIGIVIPLMLSFNTEVLKRTDETYGWLMGAYGFGGILGGLISSWLDRKFPTGKVIFSCMVLEALCLLLFVYSTNYIYAITVAFVWGAIIFLRIPFQLNYISRYTRKEFSSRLNSVLDLAFVLPNISGAIMISLIGNALTTVEILKYMAFGFIAILILRTFTKEGTALLRPASKSSKVQLRTPGE